MPETSAIILTPFPHIRCEKRSVAVFQSDSIAPHLVYYVLRYIIGIETFFVNIERTVNRDGHKSSHIDKPNIAN